jgi:SRSO17 transposase
MGWIFTMGAARKNASEPTQTIWRPGEAPLPPASRLRRGRCATRLRRDEMHQPASAKTLALEFPAEAWQTITWRDGSNTPLTSRFASWRVRPAHHDASRNEPAQVEWLLIEWLEGATEPDHYSLSTMAVDISLERMVDRAKLRWPRCPCCGTLRQTVVEQNE